MREKRGAYHKLDAKKFVKAWQTSESVPEAMKKYGWKKAASAFSAVACNLRKRGVALINYRVGSGRQAEHDYAELAKLARSFSK